MQRVAGSSTSDRLAVAEASNSEPMTAPASHNLSLSSANSVSGDGIGGSVLSGGVGAGRVTSTAGVGEGRGQQLTVDVKEKERLDDIMAVAQ